MQSLLLSRFSPTIKKKRDSATSWASLENYQTHRLSTLLVDALSGIPKKDYLQTRVFSMNGSSKDCPQISFFTTHIIIPIQDLTITPQDRTCRESKRRDHRTLKQHQSRDSNLVADRLGLSQRHHPTPQQTNHQEHQGCMNYHQMRYNKK